MFNPLSHRSRILKGTLAEPHSGLEGFELRGERCALNPKALMES